MDKALYERYVATDCWKTRRDAYLRIRTSCECCGRIVGKSLLQVHHLSYERFGHEPDDDLLAVCESCHKLMHGLPGMTKPSLALGFLRVIEEHQPAEKIRKVIEIVERRANQA